MHRLRYSVEIKLTQTRINGFNVHLFTGKITGNHGFSNMGCSSQFSSKPSLALAAGKNGLKKTYGG
jgi:hypothetical protein